jgi:hypothetical protein
LAVSVICSAHAPVPVNVSDIENVTGVNAVSIQIHTTSSEPAAGLNDDDVIVFVADEPGVV